MRLDIPRREPAAVERQNLLVEPFKAPLALFDDPRLCPSMTLCIAVADEGASTSTDPTGGPSAWVPTPLADPCGDAPTCNDEQIQTSDATGLRIVDSGRFPGTGPFLTGLNLTGDTLSWTRAGTRRTATLTP